MPPSYTWRFKGKNQDGPTVVVLGGTHGDEMTGIEVVRRILSTLGVLQTPPHTEVRNDIRGNLYIGFGNPQAVLRRTRSASLGPDLNRSFVLDRLKAKPKLTDSPDLQRARELTSLFRRTDYLFDIHATSTPAPAFVCMGDTTPEHARMYNLLPVNYVLIDPIGVLSTAYGLKELATTDYYVNSFGGSKWSTRKFGRRKEALAPAEKKRIRSIPLRAGTFRWLYVQKRNAPRLAASKGGYHHRNVSERRDRTNPGRWDVALPPCCEESEKRTWNVLHRPTSLRRIDNYTTSCKPGGAFVRRPLYLISNKDNCFLHCICATVIVGRMNTFLKKDVTILVLLMAALAVVFFWHLNVLPLADYDEATYAQVTTDTLASGHFMTLSKFGAPWFEKPPLYFWLSMGAVKLFGTEDYVFRLVSVLAAFASCLLLWFIVKRLSNDVYVATVSSFVLLAWPFFYLASRQSRLDVPMLSMLLVSLAALIAGWKQHRWYLLIGLAIALGFMFKSFAIATAVPVILIFSFWYRDFSWLRSKFFWLGAAIGALIVVPWHWYEYARWGSGFFQNYLGQQVVSRYTEGIGTTAGFQFVRYLQVLMVHGEPWIAVFAFAVIFFAGARLTSRRFERDPLLLSALSSVLVIYCLFAFGRTNILTYLLPLFPFAAIVIALFAVKLYRKSKHIFLRVLIAVVGGLLLVYSYALASGANPTTLETMYFPWSQMQKEVGLQIRKGPADAHFYYFEWPTLEALRYYSGKELESIPFPPTPGTSLSGPWFLFLTNKHLGYFVNSDGTVKPEFTNLELKYTEQTGKYFLLYSEHDLEFLP